MRTVAVMGSPVETLLDVVRKESADLLVVGNRIKGGCSVRVRRRHPAAPSATCSSSTPPAEAADRMNEPGAGPRHRTPARPWSGCCSAVRAATRAQVAELAGMPPARTQRLWRALGFPDAADDDPRSPTPTSRR